MLRGSIARALMDARHLLIMLAVMPWRISIGICRHFSKNAQPSCCKIGTWLSTVVLSHGAVSKIQQRFNP